MADSNVSITSGSGTSIDTRTEATNGHHRQVVVLGDPSTNAGVAPVDATAGVKVNLGSDNDVQIKSNTSKDGSGTEYTPIVDTDGHLQVDVLSGGGGGTQYTEGDTDASITGTALMMEGAGDALVAAQGTAANGLEVDVTRVSGTVTVDGSGVTQPVSGTVTANLSATDNAVLDNIQSSVDDIDLAIYSDDSPFTTGTNKLLGIGYILDDAAPNTVTEGDVAIPRISSRREVYTQIRDAAGNERGVNVDASNRLAVVADLGATDNAVLDDIAANQTDASQKTQIVDGAGNVIGSTSNALDVNIASGSSSGTEYTEDAAAAADPAGPMNMAVRADSLAAVTSADGDNIALRSTNKGELYVKQTDAVPVTDNGGSLTVDVGSALPAGTNNIGKVQVTDGTDDLPILTNGGGNYIRVGMTVEGTALQQVTNGSDGQGNASSLASIGYNFVHDNTAGDWNRMREVEAGTDSDGQGIQAVGLVGQYDDTSTSTVTEDQFANVRISSDRRLLVDAQIAGQDADVTIADGGNSITIDNANLTTIAGAVSGTEMQTDVVTQPARDRATDNMGVALQTDALMSDTTALTPKFAVIDAATSGNNTLVAAVASKKIRVLACFMVSAGDLTARFEDGAGGTALTGQMTLTTNSGFVLPFNPVGWFETTANTLLNLELSAATSVDGSLVYVEV